MKFLLGGENVNPGKKIKIKIKIKINKGCLN
jgi:hypothetical protein